jgi:predicted nucleic acid-binding protein
VAEKVFVFDTSAIFAFAQNEAGADRVERVLRSAGKRECTVHVSFVSIAELYYISWQETGRSSALELVALVKTLPLSVIESTERLSLLAGSIKATCRLSFADAFVVATSSHVGGVLIHKDPEFEQVKDLIALEPLPYKTKKLKLRRI